MTPEEFEVHVNETLAKCKELLLKKNSEYAGGEDRLGGFNRPAADYGVTPLQVAGIFSGKHIDGIKTYIRETALGIERDRTEPIEGRLHDLINYCVFQLAILKDQQSVLKIHGQP